jgi:pimeloyl-ACP methyl ester carboxylesterase
MASRADGTHGWLTAAAAVAAGLVLVLHPALARAQAAGGDTFDSGGVPIHYEVIGQGPPVVLIHGFGARFDEALVPAPLRAALSGYQLIGLDVRGFGRSGKPDEPSAYGLEVTRDVIRLLDHLKVPKATLLGISMGGIIALKTAALHPDRVSALILGAQGWASEEDLAEMGASGAEVARTATEALPDELRAVVMRTGRPAFTGFVQAYPALYVTPEELDRLDMPILAVLGSEDERVRRAEALRARLPATSVIVVPGLDHVGVLVDASFGSAVSAFLAEHSRR